MSTANNSKIPIVRPASVGARGTLPEKALSPAIRATTTPTGTSRLPRRPQSDKPLPSPPVAQVVDPNSPPKASRTLVDAFTPSPMLKQWPALRPENVPPRLSSKRGSLPARSQVTSGARTPSNGREGDRVKRLSWHSSASGSSSGTGPILTISADADAVILGQDDSIPQVPAIPTVLPERSPPPRSLGALTSRITKATTSRASLSITTASPVSSLMELTANGSPVVKISPIRSMQPARKPSLNVHSPKSPSSLSPTSPDATTSSKTSVVIPEVGRSISPISDRSTTPTPTPTPQPKPMPELRDVSVPSDNFAIAHKEPPDDTAELASVLGSDDSLNVCKVRKTAPALENASPSLNSMGLLGHGDSTPNASTAELSSPSLPQPKYSRDTIRTQNPSKPGISEPAVSISVDNSLGHGTSKGRQPRRRQFTPAVSSSPAEDMSENHDKETLTKKAKAKRSIRGMFSREKTRAKTPETTASKQGFMSATRSSLAKVMRDSKSPSKVHLPRKTEVKSETEPDHVVNKKSGHPGIFAAFSNGKATPTPESKSERRDHTNDLLYDMVDRIDAQPEDSPERLRHVQIAECMILAAEQSRHANISALEAKKSAREAELYADRVNLEFTRLHRLLAETEIDAQSMRFITNLFTSAELDGSREDTSRGFFSSLRTAR